MTAASSYPVNVTLPKEREVNRWWGLLWFGMMLRGILAIPQFLVIFVLGLVIAVLGLVVWIPILIYGRVPELWCRLVWEVINRSTRVRAYVYLIPGGYPALGMGEQGPIEVTADFGDRRINQLWGIPIVGLIVRLIVLIPQFVVLYVLQFVAGVVAFVVWIPILIYGRYPELAIKVMDWYLRYTVRVSAYAAFLPVPYPPIGELE